MIAIGMAEKVDDQLVCSICLDRYKQPKLLPCFHTFCLACLERLGDEEETQPRGLGRFATFRSTNPFSPYDGESKGLLRKRTLVCPICREKHQFSKIGVSALPNNFCFDTINQQMVAKTAGDRKCGNGIDSNSAVAFCYDCECCLCQQCLYSHRKMIATRKHTTVSLMEKIPDTTMKVPCRLPTCSSHGAELKLYCYDCNDAVCCECAINDPHRLHKYEYLDKVASGICKRLPELLEMMNERQEKLKDRLKLFEVDWRYHSAVNGAAAINKAFDDIVEIVETRRKQVLAEWKYKGTGVKERVESIKHNLTKVSRAANFIKELDTTTKSDFELVTMLKPMMCSFEELSTSLQRISMFEDHNSQSVVTVGGDMNQLAAQLPKIVLLSHSSISTPGSRLYGSSGKDITISIHRVSNDIPLEAVTVKLSSGTTVIPTNIASSKKNQWLVEYEPLEGTHEYVLNVSVMGIQQKSRTFEYKH